MYRLFIAEDEKKLNRVIREYFENKGFRVVSAADGKEAERILKQEEFDMVLLDVMMPYMDGFEICRMLRKEKDTPVIFITARTDELDQLRGFEVKADDYVTKPFSLPVLHARVCALIERYQQYRMRREGETEDEKALYVSGGIQLDPVRRQVTVNGNAVELQPKVYALLLYFMENKNRILTRDQILNHVWGDDIFCYDRVVDNAIKKLRKALGNQAGCIKTIVKVGYKFQED